MFANSILLLAASPILVSAVALRRANPPAGWWTNGLEPYDTYHARYMALSCLTQHNTPFFDSCCHPLLKNEPLSSRPDECDPEKAVSDCDDDSSDDNDDNDDGECDQESATSTAPPSSAPSTTASSTTASSTTVQAPPKNVAPPPKASTSSTQAPRSTSKSNPPSNILASGSGGIATYFYQNGVAGSCGTVHKDTDKVVALDYRTYNSVGDCATSSLCGKTIHITDQKTGKSIDAAVADCCPTCINKSSIDLSLGAFEALAPLGDGIFDVSWTISD